MQQDTLFINCDGGARGNPGPAAAAFVVRAGGKVLAEGSKYLGEATNNIAEYEGVILALHALTENKFPPVFKNVSFLLDSELITKQLNGLYKVKNEKLRDLYHTIIELEKKLSFRISYNHVLRNENGQADLLVNKELDSHS